MDAKRRQAARLELMVSMGFEAIEPSEAVKRHPTVSRSWLAIESLADDEGKRELLAMMVLASWVAGVHDAINFATEDTAVDADLVRRILMTMMPAKGAVN